MIKAVIFDMDGVLVDNRQVHIDSFAEWCRRAGLTVDPEALVNFFGMGNAEIFPQVTGQPNLTKAQIAQFSDEKEAIYRDMFEHDIKPVEGLVALLGELKRAGVKIAVGSSGMRKNVNFVLAKCGIADYFDVIADGDMISKAKPDPEVFLLAANLLGVAPGECLVFEDSFAGIAAARAAGMPVVALATTFSREQHTDYDKLIDNFTQITLEELGIKEK